MSLLASSKYVGQYSEFALSRKTACSGWEKVLTRGGCHRRPSDAEEVTDAEEESEVESVVADAEDAEEEPRITDTVQTYTLQMLRRGGKKPNHQTAVQNGSLFVLEI